MSEFKGTKGEWEAHFGETIGVASKNPLRIIADVELDKDISEDEQRANAKLIAAAPELLEALIAAKETIEALEGVAGVYMHSPEMKKINSAINKALGQ